jgi:tetratricopeptide (TPR) repeat protein
MTPSTSPRAPERLRVQRALELLPGTPELRPFLELLVSSSQADPERRWTASGELGSVGDRLVDAGGLNRAAGRLAAQEARRTEALLLRTARIVTALAADDTERAVDELLEQGADDESQGRPDSAESWYLAAHRIARDRGSPRAPGALRRLARVIRGQGRLDEAARAYEEAWSEAGDHGLDGDRIIAATGRGNIEVDRGRWALAEVWYRRGLELLGEEGPPRRERWQLAQNLAIVRRRLEDLEGAERWLERARAEGEALNDPDAAVEVANGLGQLLLARGDARGAETRLRAALTSARTPKARVTIGVNLGEALLAQGRDLEAGEVARQAEALALAHRVVGKLPEVYRLLAGVARARGESDAFVLLERALEVVRAESLPPFEEALTLRELARSVHERGDEERAAELEARAERLLNADEGADES